MDEEQPAVTGADARTIMSEYRAAGQKESRP